MARVNILCTKKIEPLLAGKAAVHDIRIKVIPFIRIHFLVNQETADAFMKINDNAVFIFTSSNAVEAFYKLVKSHQLGYDKFAKVYAMDGRTVGKIKELFPQFQIVNTAPKASELAKHIIANNEKKLVFLCGNLRRQELPSALKEKGIELEEIQVYRTESTPEKVEEKFDGVIFFSPSACSSFFGKNQLSTGVSCFAVGETTAQAIKEHTNNKIIVADHPTQELVIDTIIDYYKRK